MDGKNISEEVFFNNAKKRELSSKYKKAYDWIQKILVDGDKDYAEKLLKILDKWKKAYDDRINSAKNYLHESDKSLKIPDFEMYLKEDNVKTAIDRINKKQSFLSDLFKKIDNEPNPKNKKALADKAIIGAKAFDKVDSVQPKK